MKAAVNQTWSASQWAEISAMAAEIVAKEAMAAAGGALELVVFDYAAVRTITGLSRHTIPKVLAVTETSAGKFGVTLGELRRYLAAKTKPARLSPSQPQALTVLP
jgi:hypothetical protein